MSFTAEIWETYEGHLCSPFTILDELIKAAEERRSPADISSPPAWFSNVRLYNIHTVAYFYDQKYKYLYREYINHTLLPTDHTDNITTKPIVWTESAMLADIGDVVTYDSHEHGFRLWAIQRYQMLIRMKWIYPLNFTNYGKTTSDLGKVEQKHVLELNSDHGGSWSATYAAALSAYNAQTSYNVASGFNTIKVSEKLHQNAPYYDHVKITTLRSGFVVTLANTGSVQHIIDYYVYPQDSPPPFEEDDEGLGWTLDIYNFAERLSENTGTQEFTNYLTDLSAMDASVADPPLYPDTNYQTIGRGWSAANNVSLNSPFVIVKYDGPNGFEYRGPDW